ncbi:MAG: apolipoprotein N-acyltransferase, partial [Planctomycetota bacterium]
MGFAWSETIAAIWGVLGLGLFFYQQSLLNKLWHKALLSFVTGFSGYGIACFWLPDSVQYLTGANQIVSILVAGIAVAYQSMVFVIFAWVMHLLAKFKWAFVATPAVWFFTEQLFPMFYPSHVGHLLADHPNLCQIAELGGSAFVSLQAATIAFCFSTLPGFIPRFTWNSDGSSQRKLILSTAIVAVVLCGISWGNTRLKEIETKIDRASLAADSSNLLVVQAQTERKSSHRRMLAAAKQVGSNADLVIWPECAIGQYDQTLTDFSDSEKVKDKTRGKKCPQNPFPGGETCLLAGGDSYVECEGVNREYVSAFLFDASQTCIGRHDKIELMPGGEYIPFESIFPSIRTLIGSDRIISRGKSAQPIGSVNGMNVGTLLCCEDMHPRLARSMTNNGAHLLVSIGNGVAFKSVVALNQHFRISKMRSIENRKFFVRGNSHGVSAVVSPSGKTINSIPSMEDNAMLVSVPRVNLGRTMFGKYGEFIPWTIGI